ncbi:MAG: hypothetical protein QXD77_03185 [Candidatus Aenigmatarchaeota archaeon]
MADYKDMKTGTAVNVSGDKFAFPSTGAKILLKSRPPVAKEVKSD